MAIEVKVVSGGGAWQGAASSITNYSVKEESTPLAAHDLSGATGSVVFGVADLLDPKVTDGMDLLGSTIRLTDPLNGSTVGAVRTLEFDSGGIGIEGESKLTLLNVTRNILGHKGTLGTAFLYYFGLVGITSGEFYVDADIRDTSVDLPGWSGNVWEALKYICSAKGIEIALVSDLIVVRPLRGRVAVNSRNSRESLTISMSTNAARYVEVYYYNNEYSASAPIFPVSELDTRTFSVGAAEVNEFTETVNASIISLVQPRVVDTVTDFMTQTNVYMIVDREGRIVPVGDWDMGGGRVVVSVGNTPSSLVITVTGMVDANNAPYTLGIPYFPAFEEGDKPDIFPALKLSAEVIVTDPVLVTIPTGANPNLITQEVGITVQNPFISTMEEALSAGILTAAEYCGVTRDLTVSASRINRKGESGSARGVTYDEFFVIEDETYDEFAITWNGQTYNDFEEFYNSYHDEDFENQAFGNVAGARVYYRNAWYRIRTVTIGPNSVDYTAEDDTIVDDFEAVFDGMTYDEYDLMMAGRTYDNQASYPLWRI